MFSTFETMIRKTTPCVKSWQAAYTPAIHGMDHTEELGCSKLYPMIPKEWRPKPRGSLHLTFCHHKDPWEAERSQSVSGNLCTAISCTAECL